MSSQISGLNMAVRNSNDGISFLQTVEGATKEISSMLGRMRELAVQAASGTYTTADQAALDLEFGALIAEIDRVATDTEFNGEAVLKGVLTDGNGSSNDAALTKNIQVGTDANQTIALSINTWRPTSAVDLNAAIGALAASNAVASAYGAGIMYGEPDGGTDVTATGVSADRITVASTSDATESLTQLDAVIAGASAERAKYGAYMSRLQHAADNLANVATNTAASRSQIADADYAAETTELARTQIISQASTAMLAQANQVKQTVLALLK